MNRSFTNQFYQSISPIYGGFIHLLHAYQEYTIFEKLFLALKYIKYKSKCSMFLILYSVGRNRKIKAQQQTWKCSSLLRAVQEKYEERQSTAIYHQDFPSKSGCFISMKYGASIKFSTAAAKHCDQKTSYRANSLFGLHFQIIVQHWKKSEQKLRRGWVLEAGAMAFSVCFLIQPRSTSLLMVSPPMDWALPH